MFAAGPHATFLRAPRESVGKFGHSVLIMLPTATPVAQGQPAMTKMSVTIPAGVSGGQMLQVQTPSGLMQVMVPNGLSAGQSFEMMVPSVAAPPMAQPVQQQPVYQQQPPPQQQQPNVVVVNQPPQVVHVGGPGYGYGYGYGPDPFLGRFVGGMSAHPAKRSTALAQH